MAPIRLAPNAAVEFTVSRKRLAKTTLAMKIGRNAIATATRRRGRSGSASRTRPGTAQFTATLTSRPA